MVTQQEIDEQVARNYYTRDATVLDTFAYKLYKHERISVIVKLGTSTWRRRVRYAVITLMREPGRTRWSSSYRQSAPYGWECLGQTREWFRRTAWDKRIKSKTWISPEGWN